MPASLPGENRTNNLANPSAGKFVTFDPLSGPKGSPLDAKITTGYGANNVPTRVADPTNLSTGALSTGIGIGAGRIIAIGRIFASGYDDDFIPGQKQTYSAPPPNGNVATNTVDSTRMYIGGGRMVAGSATDKAQGRPFIPSPYTAGVSIFGAGNGGARDAGTGPVYTGFEMKMVTAAGAVANGAAIEGTWINRSGVAMVLGQSAFGSSNAAAVAPTLADEPEVQEQERNLQQEPPPYFMPPSGYVPPRP